MPLAWQRIIDDAHNVGLRVRTGLGYKGTVYYFLRPSDLRPTHAVFAAHGPGEARAFLTGASRKEKQ